MEVNNTDLPVLLDSGDLQILVTFRGQGRTWLGHSSCISLASPVWNKELVSNEWGNYDEEHKRLDLSEDYGEALLILLRIAHLQFEKLPSTMDMEMIAVVAELCEKYDCVRLVKPWLALWLPKKETEYEDDQCQEWLYRALVFGVEYTFEMLAIKLIKEIKTNYKGPYLSSPDVLISSLIPPDLIESMMTIRQTTIKHLLKVAYDAFDPYLMDDDETTRLGSANSKECDAIVCGSLLIGLHALGLWPQKSADTINISVQDLATHLCSLTVWQYPSHCCGQNRLSDQVHCILSNIPSPVLESHRPLRSRDVEA